MTAIRSADDVERVAVIGAGIMGHGIALAYAMDGYDVALYDADESVLAAAPGRVRDSADTFVEAGHREGEAIDAALEGIDYPESLPSAVSGVDLVTEAVTEDLAVKESVFRDLDEHAPADALLASNTSGLSITALGEAVSDPGRVLGTHWFNPPHIVPLVEVIHGVETDEVAIEVAYEVLESMGKTPVEVERDVPGYIGNRIQLAMAYEALSLLERGVADAEAIDRAISAGFGFRLPVLGILEKADHSGLDVHLAIEEYLMPDLDRGTDPSTVLEGLVSEGHFGVKTGRGIYEWDRDPAEIYQERDRRLLDLLETYESFEDE